MLSHGRGDGYTFRYNESNRINCYRDGRKPRGKYRGSIVCFHISRRVTSCPLHVRTEANSSITLWGGPERCRASPKVTLATGARRERVLKYVASVTEEAAPPLTRGLMSCNQDHAAWTCNIWETVLDTTYARDRDAKFMMLWFLLGQLERSGGRLHSGPSRYL